MGVFANNLFVIWINFFQPRLELTNNLMEYFFAHTVDHSIVAYMNGGCTNLNIIRQN